MPEDRYQDLAGEWDEVPPDDGTLEMPAPGVERFTYVGTCHGGPWDGAVAETRFPQGFLLVHMPSRRLWIYDRVDSGIFVVRGDAVDLKDEGPDNRWRAADEGAFDVRVLDAEVVA